MLLSLVEVNDLYAGERGQSVHLAGSIGLIPASGNFFFNLPPQCPKFFRLTSLLFSDLYGCKTWSVT